jgi:hypothetical protein
MSALVGFESFVRDTMQISTVFLPIDSPVIVQSYDLAVAVVSPEIQQISPLFYDTAVYNLAADYLINYAPDVAPYTFFEELRAKFDCIGFVSGVVTSSSDSGTSQSLQVPSAFSEITLSDLQRFKTKYGRRYVEIAQQCSNSWGMS